MASRHNRKRTRSRPRNRNSRRQQFQSNGFSAAPPPSALGNFPLPQRTFDNGMPFWGPYTPCSLASAQQLQQQQQQQQRRQQEEYDAAMEAERVRMFGGEAGDDVALCSNMLGVVMGLFGGNVDYQDP